MGGTGCSRPLYKISIFFVRRSCNIRGYLSMSTNISVVERPEGLDLQLSSDTEVNFVSQPLISLYEESWVRVFMCSGAALSGNVSGIDYQLKHLLIQNKDREALVGLDHIVSTTRKGIADIPGVLVYAGDTQGVSQLPLVVQYLNQRIRMFLCSGAALSGKLVGLDLKYRTVLIRSENKEALASLDHGITIARV